MPEALMATQRNNDALMGRRASATLLIAVVSAACSPSENSMGLAGLVADPVAPVRMANAEELAHFSHERESEIEGPSYAFDTYLYGTQASSDDAIAFFERELGRLGWTRDDIAISMGSTDLKAIRWCKPRTGTGSRSCERPPMTQVSIAGRRIRPCTTQASWRCVPRRSARNSSMAR